MIRVNYEAMIPLVRQATVVCESNGDRYGEAWCLHLIGHTLGFGAPQESIGPLTEARDIFADLARPWEVAWSNRFIGSAYCDIGEADRGLDLMLGSISAFRELGDQWQTAYGLFLVGHNLLVLEGHGPRAARPYLRRCLRLSEQIGDRVWAAHALSRLGLASLRLGDADAESLLRDAAERHRLLGDDICLSSTYGYLGDICEESGNVAEAAGLFAQAIRVAERIKMMRSVAASFDRIARLATKRGRPEEADRLVGAVHEAISDGFLPPHPAYDSIHEEMVALLGVPPPRKETIESLIPFALEVAESIREEPEASLVARSR